MQLISVSKRTRRLTWGHGGKAAYEAKPRIYFAHDGEGVLEHLTNRTSRPLAMYRQQIPMALKLLGLPADTKVRWSKHAGCSMCPCSPGFIVEADLPWDRRHWDAWATVTGELIDTRDPAAVARAQSRAAQILADPTLTPDRPRPGPLYYTPGNPETDPAMQEQKS